MKDEGAHNIAILSALPYFMTPFTSFPPLENQVEATKFTEVGFHGRDVDQIIRDLVEISVNMTKKRRGEMVRAEAQLVVEQKILTLLVGDNSPQRYVHSFHFTHMRLQRFGYHR